MRKNLIIPFLFLAVLVSPIYSQTAMPKIEDDREKDIHGLEYMNNADLVVFMAGNQFMVMPEFMEAFQKKYPEVKKIYYETLPPGLLLKQILAGGATFREKQLRGDPDVYASVTSEHMEQLKEKGYLKEYREYVGNRLVLAVPKGNPKGIATVKDLAKKDVRISHTNPITEGITIPTMEMYRRAGGDELVYQVMMMKAADGTTKFTKVHHRETPEALMGGTADAGNVWLSEYLEYEKNGWPIEKVEPGESVDMRDSVRYVIAKVEKTSKNAQNADKFLSFMMSDEAQDIYAKYGFVPLYPARTQAATPITKETKPEAKGICGPTVLVAITVLPLLGYFYRKE